MAWIKFSSLMTLAFAITYIGPNSDCEAFSPSSSTAAVASRPLRSASSTSSSLKIDPVGITDFVQGLDSALGNPTSVSEAATTMAADIVAASDVAAAASTASVEMAIPNSAVLVGGGVVTVSMGALAAFLASSGQNQEENSGDMSGSINLDQNAVKKLEAGIGSATVASSEQDGEASWTSPGSASIQ